MLLESLDRTLWEPILFHRDASGTSRLVREARQLDVDCRFVPRITRSNLAVGAWRFMRELADVKAVVLHAHLNWMLTCRHELMTARLTRVPVVIATAHLFSGLAEASAGMKRRVQAAMIDRFVAVSDDIKKHLVQEFGVLESKVTVVHNGISVPLFGEAPDPRFRSALIGGDPRSIVFTAARLHPQKGLPYLLEAARLVPDACFVLAGEGPDRGALEARSKDLGLEGRVLFLGQRDDIPRLLANCDLFVLPSLYEGLPLTVLEAMAAGRPVIATAIGGTDGVIIPGETGLLVPPGDPVALAEAIGRLLRDRPLAARLAAAGQMAVERQFSATAMARGMSEVYRKAVGSGRRRSLREMLSPA
jgi:glycosyltransferase involved in cell wall biosynthesis